MPRAAVLITYREIARKEPKIPDLHAILKKYERQEVIFFLAKLNCLLGTWQNTPNFELDVRISTYLLKHFQAELNEARRRGDTKVVFSRFTLLYLIKQASIVCPEKGQMLNTHLSHSEIGICCLMANDLVLPFVPSANDGLLERLTNLLPFADYISHDSYPMEIARTQLILGVVLKLPSLTARVDFIDFELLFQEHLNLSTKTFCELGFGCSSKFMNIKLEEIEANPEAAVMRKRFFEKSKIPSEDVTQFFRKIAITTSDFVERIIRSKDRPGNDLTIFQAFPLIEITQDVFACLDPGFLIDKAGRGFYWTMYSEVDNEQRGKLAPFWGVVFESYLNYILEKSYSAGGKFFFEPKFSNGDAAFDACLLEGRNLLVFEHKSSVIRADSKYAGDPLKLKGELDLKFIDGDSEGAKGLSQLSNHLKRFLAGDNLGDLSHKQVDRVYPILVCLESSMVVPYLGLYLNEKFQAMFPGSGIRQVVTPVFTLGASDVENLLGYLQSSKFSDILESYHSKNKRMLTSFSSSEVPLLKNKKAERNIVLERFSSFADATIKDFFGDVPENAEPPVI